MKIKRCTTTMSEDTTMCGIFAAMTRDGLSSDRCDAALKLMDARESFEAVSLRSVTRAAGVVPGAFYRHFSSMDELGLALVDESFRALMTTLWAEDKLKLEPIPPDDELFGKELNGEAIERVRRRVPAGKGVSKEYRSMPPALEGVKYKGRWGVIYSRTDIGCA